MSELILSEEVTPATPASGQDSFFMSNETYPRLRRVDSNGNVWPLAEILMMSLASDYSLSNVATAQKSFGATANGAITLPASSAYLLEFLYVIANTGTISHTWSVLFGGTATLTSGLLDVTGRSGITSAATLTADASAYTTALGSALVVTSASTSATEQVVLRGRGAVRINAGGTFIPQIQLSAATGVAALMKAGSYISLTPFGANTATNLGAWT